MLLISCQQKLAWRCCCMSSSEMEQVVCNLFQLECCWWGRCNGFGAASWGVSEDIAPPAGL